MPAINIDDLSEKDKLKMEVEQLRKEVKLERQPVSKCSEEIKNYIEERSGEDPLVKGIPEEKNPFKEKGGCIIDKEINPFVDKWEEEGQFPAHQVFKTLGKAGFLGIDKPTEYGGLNLDFSYITAVAEELGWIRCGAIPMAVGVQSSMATPALARFGTDELKKEFLAPTIAGNMVACLGVSELGAGSDAASIHIAKKIDKLDMRSSDTVEIFFENVRIPSKYLIGEEGMGFNYQMLQFQEERIWGVASCLYICGNDVNKLVSMAKLKCGRLRRQIPDSCLQFWGGMGYTNEVLVSRMYRNKKE